MIDHCPSTLKPGFQTYSPAALRRVFLGKKVSHILPFSSPENDEQVNEAFIENRKRLSISGVQKKLSLRLEKNKLQLTGLNEHGRFILKPVHDDLKRKDQVPANEHVTMQIAEQIFGIPTAANALIFFQDDTPAYITQRFDYNADGSKRAMEDFATLGRKTKDNAGEDFKYEASCEDLFGLLKENVGPYLVEAQKLFRLVLFNYAFSNGDAHLKNFSLLETDDGDSTLSPAYDLICTRVHVNDPDIAFKDGLFSSYETKSFAAAGLPEVVVMREIALFNTNRSMVDELVDRSFLDEKIKQQYKTLFHEKLKRLAYSFVKSK
jgi:serine/threonine-protein kinase HipA